MSHTGTAHPFHMWTKFGDDMSKRSWVMLDKTDRLTDRQTDRQTNRQTNKVTNTQGENIITSLTRVINMQETTGNIWRCFHLAYGMCVCWQHCWNLGLVFVKSSWDVEHDSLEHWWVFGLQQPWLNCFAILKLGVVEVCALGVLLVGC